MLSAASSFSLLAETKNIFYEKMESGHTHVERVSEGAYDFYIFSIIS